MRRLEELWRRGDRSPTSSPKGLVLLTLHSPPQSSILLKKIPNRFLVFTFFYNRTFSYCSEFKVNIKSRLPLLLLLAKILLLGPTRSWPTRTSWGVGALGYRIPVLFWIPRTNRAGLPTNFGRGVARAVYRLSSSQS